MIEQDVGIAKIVITDAEFGSVQPGDATFVDRWIRHFDDEPQAIAWMNQVHSATVRAVDDKPAKVRVFEETDGIWTDQPGIMLVTKTADCVPILLWSEKEAIIAALHVGWKGFAKGIIESFAQQMQDQGFDLSSFSATFGPHLRWEHFEVQQDFIDVLPQDKRRYLRPRQGAEHYDITQGVQETLKNFGIESISDSGIDTYGNPAFFSYRHWTHLPEEQRPEQYSTFANTIVLK